MMRPSVIILLLVASHICYGAPSGAEYPIPDIPVDVALEDNQVEKRAECTDKQQDKSLGCRSWQSQGFCNSSSIYHHFMINNCYASCGLCTMPPTPPPQVDATACLKAHNNRRALHGTPALVWNNSLTQHAQEWAEYLLSKESLVHASGIDEGENLAWGYGPTFRTCVQAMEGWYDNEEPQYDYDNPGFSKATGHFTQVVWRSTKSVGVALTTKKANDGYIKTFIVARYYPAGNVRRQFAQNVPRKI